MSSNTTKWNATGFLGVAVPTSDQFYTDLHWYERGAHSDEAPLKGGVRVTKSLGPLVALSRRAGAHDERLLLGMNGLKSALTFRITRNMEYFRPMLPTELSESLHIFADAVLQ